MQERVTTSFIPKASLQVERQPTMMYRGVGPLFAVLAGALLAIAVIVSVGMFLFEKYTKQNIEKKIASLERSRAAFDPVTITQLLSLDTRIQTGKKLLAAHPALSNLFDELEKQTLSSVRFKSFTYDIDTSMGDKLSLSGDAPSFNAVAVQSETFAQSALFSEPIFSDVNIGALGVVGFNFSSPLDEELMRYVPANSAPSDESLEIP